MGNALSKPAFATAALTFGVTYFYIVQLYVGDGPGGILRSSGWFGLLLSVAILISPIYWTFLFLTEKGDIPIWGTKRLRNYTITVAAACIIFAINFAARNI